MSDIYIDAEKRLAALLGWTEVREGGHPLGFLLMGMMPTAKADAQLLPPNRFELCKVPSWTRSWLACGPLMVEHELDIEFAVDISAVRAFVNTNNVYYKHEEQIAEHSSKEDAVRFAIVQAVIAKLESGITAAR